jgi:hypothetical protein
MNPAARAELSPWGVADESPAVPATSLTLTGGTPFVLCGGAGDIGEAALDGVFVGDTRILQWPGPHRRRCADRSPGHHPDLAVPRRDGWPYSGLRPCSSSANTGWVQAHPPTSGYVTYGPRTATYLVGSDLAGRFEVKDAHPPAGRATGSIHDGFLGLGRSDGPLSATLRPSPSTTAAWRRRNPVRSPERMPPGVPGPPKSVRDELRLGSA